jgi:preprotein translocase subunit SecG
MFAVLLPVHILISVMLILVVLLQQSKGAGLSPVFGGGQSVFGAKGAASFLSKMTAVLAILFMVSSILLAISPRFSTRQGGIEEELRKDLLPTETMPETPGEGMPVPPAEEGGGE